MVCRWPPRCCRISPSRLARVYAWAVAASLCGSIVLLSSGPARAAVTHRLLRQITEVPASESVPFPGPLSGVNALTVDSGEVYVAEHIEGSLSFRLDVFGTPGGGFVRQFPQVPSLNAVENGIGIRHPGGEEPQVYVGGSEEGLGRVAVFSTAGSLLTTWTGAATPEGTFGEGGVRDVAVDESTALADWAKGDVFEANRKGGGVEGQINIFRPGPGGAEPAGLMAQIKGTCASPGVSCPGSEVPFEQPGLVAVDRSSGDVLVVDERETPVVDIFEPTGLNEYVFVRQLTGPPGGTFGFVPGVALADGNAYVVNRGANVVDEFDSTGALVGKLKGDEVPGGTFSRLGGIGVDSSNGDVLVGDYSNQQNEGFIDVFGPDTVVPDATTAPASNVGSSTAVLNGSVALDGEGPGTCEFLYGTTEAFGHSVPCPPLSGEGGPVSTEVTGLAPDTTYVYRLGASNKNGSNPGESSQNQTFTTVGPGLRGEWVSGVTAESATLNALVNPNGKPTNYLFEYGPTSSYGSQIPSTAAAIGAGESDSHLEQHIQGLLSGDTYHFRLVVLTEAFDPESGTVRPARFESSDHTFEVQTASHQTVLPDGRHWELVSPANKHGALIESIGRGRVTQAAVAGGALTYLVNAPTEDEPAGFADEVQVLSVRGPQGWTSQDIATPHHGPTPFASAVQEYRGFSEDLSKAALNPIGTFVPLSEAASEQTAYLRRDFEPGAPSTLCTEKCFEPLVSGKEGFSNVPGGTVFGEGECSQVHEARSQCGPEFLGGTPDLGRAILGSAVPLVEGAGADALYEWAGGALSLVSVLPGGAASSVPSHLGGPASGTGPYVARGATSADGSRVVWSEAVPGGHLYLRDVARHETVQLDAIQGGSGRNGVSPVFQVASADGTRVFFSDRQRLTSDSGAGTDVTEADLYECVVAVVAGKLHCALSDVTPRTVGGERAGVQDLVVGASRDASWIYFVANGALAPGAVKGTCSNFRPDPTGLCNLYVWHEGAVELVAVLSGEDEPNWNGDNDGVFLGNVTARVSPSGRWLAFMSQRTLTGYDPIDAVTGNRDQEVYLYHASTAASGALTTGSLRCASCNPSGARPVALKFSEITPGLDGYRGLWEGTQGLAASVPAWTTYRDGIGLYQSRYLSDSGRLFFNATDALVPTDGNHIGDVYEFEPDGVGGCSSSVSAAGVVHVTEVAGSPVDGCVGLISSGSSADESGFLDASESGGDVFFFSTSKLSPQDLDSSRDIYDAHECSTLVPCFPEEAMPPPPCRSGDSCKPAPTVQPSLFGAPASATFSGPGNVPSGQEKGKSAAELRADKLKHALRLCRRKRNKRKRRHCEALAHRHYGSVASHRTLTHNSKHARGK